MSKYKPREEKHIQFFTSETFIKSIKGRLNKIPRFFFLLPCNSTSPPATCIFLFQFSFLASPHFAPSHPTRISFHFSPIPSHLFFTNFLRMHIYFVIGIKLKGDLTWRNVVSPEKKKWNSNFELKSFFIFDFVREGDRRPPPGMEKKINK